MGASTAAGGPASDQSVVRPNGARRTKWLRRFQAVLLPILLIIIWQLVVVIYQPPAYRLPAPSAVWEAFITMRFRWPLHVWTTAQEALGGFVIAVVAGMAMALVIAWSPLFQRLLLPSIVVFDTLPKVALAPLFIIYLGIGIFPNMMIAAMIAFFPVLINTVTGLQQTSQDLLDLARSLDAPKWKIFLRIRLPYAVPFILSGVRIASTLAVTGAVFGEFLASQRGLGNIVIQTQVSLQTHLAFAGLVYLAFMGYGLYAGITKLGAWLFPWAVNDGNHAS